ncbi:MAG TPA: MFS transporter [Symbiobacteriaceae bacterium]|nr:MFS transporter [Symbiobacteriaceae bacterium]
MHQRNRPPRLLMVIMGASLLFNLGFNLYRSVLSNFAASMGITEGQYGLLEGIREIPGLATMFLVALAARAGDRWLYTISAVLTGLGIWLYATSQNYADLITATLVQSVGFHIWGVVQDSMVLKATAEGDRARQLGRINSVGAAAGLIGMGVVAVTGRWLGMRSFFMVGGVAVLVGALVTLLLSATGEKRSSSLSFNWKYRSYYILTLLQGARRHIVLTFAAFALVRLHGASVQTMALLLAAHSFLSIWTRPLIGRIIDRMGEQRALSLNYAVVALVFLGYALIGSPYIIYGLFILDNVLTGFDIAVSTHAGRIIPRHELSASLATGTSINHIFGVLVPVMGGLLWQWFGPRIPFLMGVGIVLVAMAYSWNLDARTQAVTAEQAG